jgi:hypothetical protein
MTVSIINDAEREPLPLQESDAHAEVRWDSSFDVDPATLRDQGGVTISSALASPDSSAGNSASKMLPSVAG